MLKVYQTYQEIIDNIVPGDIFFHEIFSPNRYKMCIEKPFLHKTRHSTRLKIKLFNFQTKTIGYFIVLSEDLKYLFFMKL